MEIFPYRRIVVVGLTGCGKSWLAERLALRLDLDYIDLDALFWKPGWVESSESEFRLKVENATRSPAWALAGNYHKVRDFVWPRAEALIWLDYPFLVDLARLWKRTWQRWHSKELLWGTNYERLWPMFKLWSKESLFNWLVRNYGRFKRQYPRLFTMPEYSHLKVFRFRQPRATEDWLDSLPAPAKSGDQLHDP